MAALEATQPALTAWYQVRLRLRLRLRDRVRIRVRVRVGFGSGVRRSSRRVVPG